VKQFYFRLFVTVFVLFYFVVPLTYGQNDASTIVVRGLVVDEVGNPVQNASVDVWQVLTQRQRRGRPLIEWFMEASIETGVDGSFNVSVKKGVNYRFYVYTADLRYVPVVIQRFIDSGPIEELIFRLFPAASILLEGDVLFVDSFSPWISVSPLTFSISPVAGSGVDTYSDSIDSFPAHSRFGLSPGQMVVPANVLLQVEVDAADRSFVIDDLPVLMHGQTTPVDIRKYSLRGNLPIVQGLLEYVEGRLNEAEQKGFYIVAERRDLTRANDLFISAKDKLINELYEECYADLRQAYVIGEHVSQRILVMYADVGLSTLVLPFFFSFTAAAIAFFMFEREAKKAIVTCAIYAVLLIVYYFTYPGCRIIGVSSFLQTALIWLGTTLFISFLLPRLFKEKAVKGRIALRSAIIALFSMAKRGLKRRKLRFILTLVTVSISIMGFVALTSMSMEYGLIFRGTLQRSPSDGILIREAHLLPIEERREVPFLSLLPKDVDWLQAREGISLVAPKTENKPYYETIPLGQLTFNGQSEPFYGVLGILPNAEATITNLDIIVSEGRYLFDDDTDAILLGSRVAEELGVTVGSELSWVSRENTLKVRLVGLIDDSSFESFKDLDGQPIMPQKLYMSVPPDEGVPPVWEPKYCSADEVVVTTWQTAFNFSSVTSPIWLSRIDAKVEDPEKILPLTQQIALVRTCRVWASVGRQVYFAKLGAYPEIGGVSIVVPLIIVTLNVAVTMLTSVYERRREVYILSAVGLDPTHIMTLFMAEALIIGVIGSAIGYLLGISLYRAFPFFLVEVTVRQKFSMGWCLVAVILGVAVTVISSVIQARGASTIATPSQLRKWKIEEKPRIQGEPYVFQMPTKVRREDLEFFVSYIEKRLQDYGRGRDFSIERVKRIDEETPEEIVTRVTFRYLYRVPMEHFMANNDLVIVRKRKDSVSTVKLVSRSHDIGEKHFRRIADLFRRLILEWSTERRMVKEE